MSELQDPEIYRTVLEKLQTGVYLVDRDRKIVFWNDGAERITGYLRHDVVGRFCRENILVHCNDRGCVLCGETCPFTQTIHDGKSREARIQIHHKQGHRFPVRVRIVPIRDRHGHVIGVAESFDEQRFIADRDRRQHNLAAYGCLDERTGTPNHGFTEFHLRENLASFTEYHLPFSILRIQVNQFEHFEATYGRKAGDAILLVAAETIRNSLRPGDFLGRWTGDQFLVILIGCGAAGVETACERIRKAVSCAGLQWWGDELPVNISIGSASALAGDTNDSLLQRAEHSLGQASAHRAAAAASQGSLGVAKS